MSKVTPLFIFSLPRSGSTLLQRLIATHPKVHTESEPWLLLPSFLALDEEGGAGVHKHITLSRAITDCCSRLPDGKNTYYARVRDFAEGIYSDISPVGSKYFIDKTPRYHLVASHIVEAFPDARFIFLWRNPLAVVSSIVKTFNSGKWKVEDYGVDLYQGLHNLTKLAESAPPERCFYLRFEELLRSKENVLSRLAQFLKVTDQGFNSNAINSKQLSGRMGDPTGIHHYKSVDRAPLNKWKFVINSRLRRDWCRKYIEWIGPHRLEVMGYEYNLILNELDECDLSSGNIFEDIFYNYAYKINSVFELRLLQNKFLRLLKREKNFSIY